MGSPAPIAAAIGSSIKNASRAPAFFAASTTAFRSTEVTPEGTPITTRGLGIFGNLEGIECTFLIKYSIPSRFPKIPRPRVVIGVPSGVTSVERKAVVDAAKNAGAREAFLIEEPMAAAIGAGLPIQEPQGTMIVDMGGGTTEIAVISLGGIVINKSLRTAGDELDHDIINYAKTKHNLLIGERTAEDIKFQIGSADEFEGEEDVIAILRGRDLKTGLPKSIEVRAQDIREATKVSINNIVSAIKDAVEETPPELVPDILTTGIILAGGTSLLRSIDKFISKEVKVNVTIAKDPMTCVVRGCGIVLDDLALLNRVKI